MPRKIELKTQVVNKALAATVVGDVDSGNALSLREALFAAAETGHGSLLLDLKDVRKMDSAGVAVLVELHDHLAEQRRNLGLVNAPAGISGMLEMLGVFKIYTDLETGLRETQKISGPPRLHDPTKPIG